MPPSLRSISTRLTSAPKESLFVIHQQSNRELRPGLERSMEGITVVSCVLLSLALLLALSYFYLIRPACWGLDIHDIADYLEETTDDDDSEASSINSDDDNSICRSDEGELNSRSEHKRDIPSDPDAAQLPNSSQETKESRRWKWLPWNRSS